MRQLDPQQVGLGRIPRRRFLGRLGLPAVALLLLSGCGTIALRDSFQNYSSTYATAQNQQMLLNLARLSEREPIYFFQLAQISAGYTFSSTFGLSASKLIGLATNNSHTDGATLGGTATHNPVFTLVPLGGDKFAQQLLAPIKPDIFYELYEEGWPVDLLMRVLIERIELVQSDGSDTPTGNERLEVMVNDPLASDGGHYDRFLRACALAREFQKEGILYLDISNNFVPLAKVGFRSPPTDQQLLNANKDGLAWVQDSKQKLAAAPAAAADSSPRHGEDAATAGKGGGAAAEHLSEAYTADQYWQLGKNVRQTLFRLNEAKLAEAQSDFISRRPEFRGNDDLLDKFQLVLKSGIGVTDASTAKNSYQVRLVMRSLTGAMLAMANEQDTFKVFNDFREKVQRSNPTPEIARLRDELKNLGELGRRSGESDDQWNGRKQRWDEWRLGTSSATRLQALKEAGRPDQRPAEAKEAWQARSQQWEKKWAAGTSQLQQLIDGSVETVPAEEDHPVLTLKWDRADLGKAAALEAETTVATLPYKHHLYAVHDDPRGVDPALATWNRDVFRLLVQLSLQVTADPSTFALPSLLQSH